MKKENEIEILQETYEKPDLEVIQFELEESIATSGTLGSSTFCGEEVF
jgi:hypothetical protein